MSTSIRAERGEARITERERSERSAFFAHVFRGVVAEQSEATRR
ncbi:hypothetical protein [Halomicrobium salinisoli]|nr:hypothetical protein [Halomicrobium salinisoli]